MATALVTIHFRKPGADVTISHTYEKKGSFMELMPNVVDIADDCLHNSLPPGSKVIRVQLTWEATP